VKVDNMAKGKQKSDIEKLTFEEAIKELTNIVGKIEQEHRRQDRAGPNPATGQSRTI
jgi:exonuclease VII small subunit